MSCFIWSLNTGLTVCLSLYDVFSLSFGKSKYIMKSGKIFFLSVSMASGNLQMFYSDVTVNHTICFENLKKEKLLIDPRPLLPVNLSNFEEFFYKQLQLQTILVPI